MDARLEAGAATRSPLGEEEEGDYDGLPRPSTITTSAVLADGTTVFESVVRTANPDGTIHEELKTWSVPPPSHVGGSSGGASPPPVDAYGGSDEPGNAVAGREPQRGSPAPVLVPFSHRQAAAPPSPSRAGEVPMEMESHPPVETPSGPVYEPSSGFPQRAQAGLEATQTTDEPHQDHIHDQGHAARPKGDPAPSPSERHPQADPHEAAAARSHEDDRTNDEQQLEAPGTHYFYLTPQPSFGSEPQQQRGVLPRMDSAPSVLEMGKDVEEQQQRVRPQLSQRSSSMSGLDRPSSSRRLLEEPPLVRQSAISYAAADSEPTLPSQERQQQRVGAFPSSDDSAAVSSSAGCSDSAPVRPEEVHLEDEPPLGAASLTRLMSREAPPEAASPSSPPPPVGDEREDESRADRPSEQYALPPSIGRGGNVVIPIDPYYTPGQDGHDRRSRGIDPKDERRGPLFSSWCRRNRRGIFLVVLVAVLVAVAVGVGVGVSNNRNRGGSGGTVQKAATTDEGACEMDGEDVECYEHNSTGIALCYDKNDGGGSCKAWIRDENEGSDHCCDGCEVCPPGCTYVFGFDCSNLRDDMVGSCDCPASTTTSAPTTPAQTTSSSELTPTTTTPPPHVLPGTCQVEGKHTKCITDLANYTDPNDEDPVTAICGDRDDSSSTCSVWFDKSDDREFCCRSCKVCPEGCAHEFEYDCTNHIDGFLGDCGCPKDKGQDDDKDGCISDTTEIFNAEYAADLDPTVLRTYVLCPNTTFDIGTYDGDTDSYVGGMAALEIVNPNVHILCGTDGRRENDCVLRGGEQHVFAASYILDRNLTDVLVSGVTFEGASLRSVEAGATTVGEEGIVFRNCLFRDNTDAMAVIDVFTTPQQNVDPLGMTITLDSCTFDSNSVLPAADNVGVVGLVWNVGHRMNIVNCDFVNNRAAVDEDSDFVTWMIGNFNGGIMDVSGSIFKNNTVSVGLVYDEHASSLSDGVVAGTTTVSDNVAVDNIFFPTATTDESCNGLASFVANGPFQVDCTEFE